MKVKLFGKSNNYLYQSKNSDTLFKYLYMCLDEGIVFSFPLFFSIFHCQAIKNSLFN